MKVTSFMCDLCLGPVEYGGDRPLYQLTRVNELDIKSWDLCAACWNYHLAPRLESAARMREEIQRAK